MDQTQFMGLLILSIGTLLGIASIIVGIIIRPIINLNKSIVKLNDSIDRLNDENINLSTRITNHGKEIDYNREQIIKHDTEIKHIKERIER